MIHVLRLELAMGVEWPLPLLVLNVPPPPFRSRTPCVETPTGATFVIVMLYWLRCMRCLWGYMAFSSAVLLGLMGGAVWQSALEVFQVPCDVFTFYGILWNFAVVGIMAIFHPKVRRLCWLGVFMQFVPAHGRRCTWEKSRAVYKSHTALSMVIDILILERVYTQSKPFC